MRGEERLLAAGLKVLVDAWAVKTDIMSSLSDAVLHKKVHPTFERKSMSVIFNQHISNEG